MINARKIIGGATATLAALAGLTLVGGSLAVPSAVGADFVVGAPGAGDAYFPNAGNGGYDVKSYDLKLNYTPPAPAPAPIEGQLDATATIDMVATQGLDRFNLDLRGWTSSRSPSMACQRPRCRLLLPVRWWTARPTGRCRTTPLASGSSRSSPVPRSRRANPFRSW